MSSTLLLTGATGAVGGPLLAELLRAGRFDRVIALVRGSVEARTAELHDFLRREGVGSANLKVMAADLAAPACDLAALPMPDTIVHVAASTQFRASFAELEAINVHGTARLLAWAESLPRPPRVVHVSTLCIAGKHTGTVAEAPFTIPPDFVNAYEHSKWLAERRALASSLTPEIVRLGIVAGRESDGQPHRAGALHTTLRWLRRGLLPLVPGNTATRVELISTDLVARFMVRLLDQPAVPGGIYHLSAGAESLRLGEFLDLAVGMFARHDVAWRDSQILPPVIAPSAAFDAFRTSVLKSRDLLLNQVLASADAFLPMLLFPKVYATTRAELVWGGPLPRPAPAEFAARIVTATLTSGMNQADTAGEAA